jgi:hypothetical protein
MESTKHTMETSDGYRYGGLTMYDNHNVIRVCKNMSDQRLQPADREAIRGDIVRAETCLLKKYPELDQDLEMVVDWNSGSLIAVDRGRDGAADHDALVLVSYCSLSGDRKYFSFQYAVSLENGRASPYTARLPLVEAPDAVLAAMCDDIDEFAACVERTICTALGIGLDNRKGPDLQDPTGKCEGRPTNAAASEREPRVSRMQMSDVRFLDRRTRTDQALEEHQDSDSGIEEQSSDM